jgi:ketosteroid isomerase-like protein
MMRQLTVFSCVGVLIALTGCAPAPAKPAPEAMVAAATALDTAFAEAFNKGDVDALDALYWNSAEVVSFPADLMEARGIAAIREANAKTVASLRGAQLTLVESHNIPVGEAVVGWGRFRLTVPGTPAPIEGRYTDVKAERDGKWVYIVDHASSPQTAAP